MNLLLVHGAGDGLGVVVDTGNEGVAISTLALTLIEGLEDNSLAASEATSGHDDNLSLLEAAN